MVEGFHLLRGKRKVDAKRVLFPGYKKETGVNGGMSAGTFSPTSLQVPFPPRLPARCPSGEGRCNYSADEKTEVQVDQVSLTQQASSGLGSSHQGELGATISFH